MNFTAERPTKNTCIFVDFLCNLKNLTYPNAYGL